MRKNKPNLIKNLTNEEFYSLRKVMASPFEFAPFVKVIHPLRGKVSFDLYPFQKTVLYHFFTKRFNIVLKFRQAGVTELIALYCLWLAMYHSHKNVVILSIKDRVAKKVLRKIKFMYRNLPDYLKTPVINGRGDDLGTSTELEFSNGSIISSIPTTEDAGRSEAVSLLVIDEAAIIRWANQIWAAAWPTLSTGGNAIVNSTPYGIGNWFHKLWVDACSGGNPFNPIRLKWFMHPERDINWYNEQRQTLGPRRTAQEIDGDFLTSGNSVFDLLDIRAMEEYQEELEGVELQMDGHLRIYGKPKPNQPYYIGADVATGRSRDYSAFSVMDRWGEEWVSFKKKIPTSQYKQLLAKTGKQWNYAVIAPESNDIGEGVASGLQEMGYRNLYYSTSFLKEKGEKKLKEQKIPGWYTTTKNRSIIIDTLETDIRTDDVIIKNPAFVQEAYTFVYNEENKPVAMGKGKKGASEEDLDEQIYNDDAILATSITNHIRKGKLKGYSIPPK